MGLAGPWCDVVAREQAVSMSCEVGFHGPEGVDVDALETIARGLSTTDRARLAGPDGGGLLPRQNGHAKMERLHPECFMGKVRRTRTVVGARIMEAFIKPMAEKPYNVISVTGIVH